jgi:hypothetical protein
MTSHYPTDQEISNLIPQIKKIQESYGREYKKTLFGLRKKYGFGVSVQDALDSTENQITQLANPQLMMLHWDRQDLIKLALQHEKTFLCWAQQKAVLSLTPLGNLKAETTDTYEESDEAMYIEIVLAKKRHGPLRVPHPATKPEITLQDITHAQEDESGYRYWKLWHRLAEENYLGYALHNLLILRTKLPITLTLPYPSGTLDRSRFTLNAVQERVEQAKDPGPCYC